MSLLSLIALVFGVLGVLFTIKQNIWCWPLALVSVITSAIEFYNERLYGDMALQFFYFVSAIYGWWFWNRERKKEFLVSNVPFRWVIILISVTIIQFFIYYPLLKYLRGDQALFDAILTALSVSVTFMMTRKWIENWMAWVLIDLAYVILYSIKHMWLFALLYLFFAIMAAYGYYHWKKKRL